MQAVTRNQFPLWQLLFAQGNYGGYVPPGGSLNPYAANPYGQPPPKKSNAWIYILLGVGGGALLLCGLCGGFGYFVFNKGMGMIAEQTKAEVQGKPVIQEHIGTIQSATADFPASIQESQKRGG